VEPNSLLFISVAALVIASPQGDADKALARAYLKHTGIDRSLKDFEKDHTPEEARIYLGYAAYISKTMIDKKIVFTWRFP
jgi:hypothetical protein